MQPASLLHSIFLFFRSAFGCPGPNLPVRFPAISHQSSPRQFISFRPQVLSSSSATQFISLRPQVLSSSSARQFMSFRPQVLSSSSVIPFILLRPNFSSMYTPPISFRCTPPKPLYLEEFPAASVRKSFRGLFGLPLFIVPLHPS